MKTNWTPLYSSSFIIVMIIMLVFLGPQILYWQRDPGICMLLQEPQITVMSGNQSRTIKLPLLKPIEVDAETTITIMTDLEIGPKDCNNTFSVNWQLAFVSNPSAIRISHEAPNHHVLVFTTGNQLHQETEEDLITLLVQDTSDNRFTHFFGTLRFKVISN
jgi:hypothetical protein